MLRIAVLADAESIHARRWCQHFSQAGYEVHLLSFKQAELEGVHCHFIDAGTIQVAGGNWRVMLKYKEVKAILRHIKPDVLHSLYATSYGMVGALAGFHPYVVTPLGTDILISPKQSVLYKYLLKYVFKKADVITTMAPHMTQAMHEMGVNPAKIQEVIFGINTTIFNRKKHQLPQGVFRISSIRNFEEVYNIPHFLKAIAKVKPKIPNLEVKLIGSGSLRDQLEQLCKELQIDDVVEFLGKVPQAKVVELLNTSHVAVSVSLSDGNALSLLESMACGVYPVVSDIPANRQWINDGLNGRIVGTNDVDGLAEALLHAYMNYTSIIGKAIEVSDQLIAQKGTWQANMQKMEMIYKLLAAEKIHGTKE